METERSVKNKTNAKISDFAENNCLNATALKKSWTDFGLASIKYNKFLIVI